VKEGHFTLEYFSKVPYDGCLMVHGNICVTLYDG